jgi:hypothetical protein
MARPAGLGGALLGPAVLSTALPSLARRGAAGDHPRRRGYDVVWHCEANPGPTRLGSARLAWHSQAWQGVAWLGWARPSLARLGAAGDTPGDGATTWRGSAQLGNALRSSAGPGSVWLSGVGHGRLGMSRLGLHRPAKHCRAHLGMARPAVHSVAWRGPSSLGGAQRGDVGIARQCLGGAWRGRHGTAQHGVAGPGSVLYCWARRGWQRGAAQHWVRRGSAQHGRARPARLVLAWVCPARPCMAEVGHGRLGMVRRGSAERSSAMRRSAFALLGEAGKARRGWLGKTGQCLALQCAAGTAGLCKVWLGAARPGLARPAITPGDGATTRGA